MSENQRESFRVEPDGVSLAAELFHEGRVEPCELVNLSAGGAKVRSRLRVQAGRQCTLGVRLEGSKPGSTAVSYVSFHSEVIEATTLPFEEDDPTGLGLGDPARPTYEYRLRNLMTAGSNEYEEAAKFVVEAQRWAISAKTGLASASPMASERERRRGFWPSRRGRFGRGSLRPGSGTD